MGTPQGDQILFAYGTVTLCGPNFHNGSAKHWFCNSLEGLLPFRAGPTTPLQHHQQAVPLQRFGLIPFRSPLLRKSQLLFFPRGTEMFQFPRFPPPGLCVQPGVTGHLPLPGFPIRRSTDRSLVGGSPWLIAATHVLHRHLAPRHPPLALCSLKIAHSSALPRETKSKESHLHFSRCSCSLCSSQRSRRDRCRSRGCGTRTSGSAKPKPGGLDRSHAPVLPCEETTQSNFDGAASSKQSSEHPVERGPVVPVPARPHMPFGQA